MSENSENPTPMAPGEGPISKREMNQLIKNYKKSMTFDDTQSVWFSVAGLMALIKHNNANGIRIYYGRHNEDDKTYPGRHNVILVATRDSKDPENPSAENSKNLLNNSDKINKDKPYKGQPLNFGALCPPRCT